MMDDLRKTQKYAIKVINEELIRLHKLTDFVIENLDRQNIGKLSLINMFALIKQFDAHLLAISKMLHGMEY